ncbi:hypothetical protein D9M69_707720 [compost metagenome]
MPDPRIGPSGGERMSALRVVEHVPGCREQIEAEAQERVAGDVQRTEMRIALITQQRRPQMPRVVGKQIEVGELGLQPA